MIGVGLAQYCIFLSFYHSETDYNDRFEAIAFKMNVAWGWSTFGLNTVLTAAILTKIL